MSDTEQAFENAKALSVKLWQALVTYGCDKHTLKMIDKDLYEECAQPFVSDCAVCAALFITSGKLPPNVKHFSYCAACALPPCCEKNSLFAQWSRACLEQRKDDIRRLAAIILQLLRAWDVKSAAAEYDAFMRALHNPPNPSLKELQEEFGDETDEYGFEYSETGSIP